MRNKLNISQTEFTEKYNNSEHCFLVKKIPADLLTPVLALLKLEKTSKYHLLLESVTGGEKKGRYSIIALQPHEIWKCENGKAYISKNEKTFKEQKKDVLKSFRAFAEKGKGEVPKEVPEMASGIFGYMGYDMIRFYENLPDISPRNIDMPDSVYFRPQVTVIFDNILDDIYITAAAFFNKKVSAEKAYEKCLKNLERIEAVLEKPAKTLPVALDTKNKDVEFTSHVSKEKYFEMIRKCKEYIKAGDAFQVVPSRRFEADFDLPPASLYRALRNLNPSPYMFYINMNGFVIAGSSPEIMIRLKDGNVTVRPIAGTRKRGATESEDIALEQDLLQDQKELSEHLMLVDLGRNDVGRVAKGGTVKVTEKMIVERYSHVMHIVSNVEGELAAKKDFVDVIMSGFPAGTVSGAPKVRAMQIIEELEPEKRQFYAGTAGYISSKLNVDTCILLRTALIKDKKIFLQAGGGVVYDSKEEDEYLETENKALALVKAAKNAFKYC